jgi:hypothetical protein
MYGPRRHRRAQPQKEVEYLVGVTMRKPSSNAYGYAIRSIPILCFAGLATVLVGHFANRRWAMQIGTCLFLSGFAVWGLANGGAFLWGFLHTVRRHGLRVFVEQPWSSTFYMLIMLFLIYAGGFFLWFMFRAFTHSK